MGDCLMEKFDEWNEVKKITSKKKRALYIKPREIFWVKIGQNIGNEEFGKGKDFLRPVVIIRQLTNDLFVGVPTTTTIKEDNDYFHKVNYMDVNKKNILSTAMLLQFKTFSKKRVLSKLGMVNKKEFKMIPDKLKRIIDPTC